MKRAVIIMSGGLDSTTIIAHALNMGYELHGLTFDYQQRHRVEIEFAKKIAAKYNISHKVFQINLREIGGSSLTDDSIEVTKYQSVPSEKNFLPSSYVPARNLIFLSIALSYAETLGITEIFAGPNKSDYNNYPDCRPDFYKSFETTGQLGSSAAFSKQKINIHIPLIDMDKPMIIKMGMKLGVDYSQTISCYTPTNDGKACGKCLSCTIRRQSFADANVEDPTIYA